VALVISDLTMSGMGGEELCRQSRELVPNLPFLFCSGNRKALGNLSAESCQNSGYVEKPFDIDLFALRVREILDQEMDEKDT
jgi:DNA-binding NtrC family response regulator